MINIFPIKILYNKFEEKFASFDQNIYNEIISDRTLNEFGYIKASEVIIEVSSILSYFVDQNIKDSLPQLESCVCAFMGWQISYHILPQNPSNFKLHRDLLKRTKNIKKLYNDLEINITTLDISWLIMCSALIREKFYKDFNYNMTNIGLDGEKERITIACNIDNILCD